MQVFVSSIAGLDPVTIYRILALRVDVFVVEQDCPYPELDGRDLEPGTRWYWTADGETITATLRTLDEPDGSVRIGRVATAQTHRGRGLAARLVERVLEDHPGRSAVLDAQSHLAAWYERFGFVRAGADFVEDGIPHTPMRREGRPQR